MHKRALYTVSQTLWLALAIGALIGSVACTPMPHQPVIGPDWANYQVTEHRVGCLELQSHCLGVPKVMAPFTMPFVMSGGCATIDFEQKTCAIYSCWATEWYAMEHEREHCKGMDHGGVIQAGWDEHLKSLHAKAAKVREGVKP